MSLRRAGALTVLIAFASLSIATASTARPPTTPVTLDPDDFQPLSISNAGPEATPWPSFELPAVASPVAIGDFQEEERDIGPRASPDQPTRAGSILKPPPKPKHKRTGLASWYCRANISDCHYAYSGGLYAAAGPALRVGDWRGRTVRVCADGRCVSVKLVDYCQCYGSRVIDLYSDAYRRLAPLSTGTVRVSVYW